MATEAEPLFGERKRPMAHGRSSKVGIDTSVDEVCERERERVRERESEREIAPHISRDGTRFQSACTVLSCGVQLEVGTARAFAPARAFALGRRPSLFPLVGIVICREVAER